MTEDITAWRDCPRCGGRPSAIHVYRYPPSNLIRQAYCPACQKTYTRGFRDPRRRAYHRRRLPLLDLHKPLTYMGAHSRARRWHGPVTGYACVDCGQPASQWSYSHAGRHEQAGTKVNQWGQTITVTWSPDPRDYQPRCIRCHNAFDRGSS